MKADRNALVERFQMRDFVAQLRLADQNQRQKKFVALLKIEQQAELFENQPVFDQMRFVHHNHGVSSFRIIVGQNVRKDMKDVRLLIGNAVVDAELVNNFAQKLDMVQLRIENKCGREFIARQAVDQRLGEQSF